MEPKHNSRRVKILRDSVARKIAAGEVIDRPFSIVRELLDNSIDSGADTIQLYTKGGGIESIRVVDNGTGMNKEDLELCFLPHATSKIEEEDDLLSLNTMGFRGEALSSITTCTRCTIISANREESHKLVVEGGEKRSLNPHPASRGTIIEAKDIFFSIPARRRFLKRPQTEGTLCRNTFLEKALPFNNIHFQFYSEGKLRDNLPGGTLLERVRMAYSTQIEGSMLDSVEHKEKNFAIKAILAKPGANRKDRKQIHIYVNNRKIQEYSFVQAVTYGYEQVLPGGVFPIAFLFIQVNPELVDFNIHPAKKEAKFRILQEIHHGIVGLIRDYLNGFHLKDTQKELTAKTQDFSFAFDTLPVKEKADYTASSGFSKGASIPRRPEPSVYKEREIATFHKLMQQPTPTMEEIEIQGEKDFQYQGQAMNLFLLFTRGNNLYVMDQHAAHERILFEKYKINAGPVQELLIPQIIEVEQDQDSRLRAAEKELKDLGFQLEREREGRWQVKGIPSRCSGMEKTIFDFLKNPLGDKEELTKELFATMACRGAVKDGDPLSREMAEEIISKALQLPVHRCPHGRPIWYEITKGELFQLLGRIV